MSSKRRRDAENVTPDFSFMDDKNKKAQWQEEGGEPLYMTKRFKDLRFQFFDDYDHYVGSGSRFCVDHHQKGTT